jgi:hypothetical protein
MGELTILLLIAVFCLSAIYTIIESSIVGDERWDIYVDGRTGEVKTKKRRVIR